MPLQATSGAASYDAFGGGVPVVPNYIEECFSCFLYTGNSSSQTITNGIDLSTKGGLVWIKDRTTAQSHNLFDTARGPYRHLESNGTNGSLFDGQRLSSFTTSGFSVESRGVVNLSGSNFASWTFRKQPKFFDVVTFTKSTSTLSVPHNLGSVPGCIIIKATNIADEWYVYHRGVPSATRNFLKLNRTFAAEDPGGVWITPTSTTFDLTSFAIPNDGNTYVAYLFAHNAGGFGLTGTDNVISCGSYTTNGSGLATVDLGYEPQWVMIKKVSAGDEANSGFWWMQDNMRGYPVRAGNSQYLQANTSDAETFVSGGGLTFPTATGFVFNQNYSGFNSATFIYIAIRRGPMKVPTSGTSVFTPKTWTGTGATANVTGIGFPSDLWIAHGRNLASQPIFEDRLRGATKDLFPNQDTVETTQTSVTSFASMDGVTFGTDSGVNLSTYNYINWAMRRAPSFFDEVCYTGTGVARTIAHNLAVAPELMIVKSRSLAAGGVVYTSSGGTGFYLRLFNSSGDSGNTSTAGALWNNTTPTSSVFSVGTSNQVNGSADTYVAYLFATCAGVSKVGSYTGTGATQTINCGFTGGARFVLIKKSTSTAPDRDWYVWDTARGMVSGTDPSVKLNTSAVEVNANDVYTISTGFQLVSSADYVNASGVTYIFLAIA